MQTYDSLKITLSQPEKLVELLINSTRVDHVSHLKQKKIRSRTEKRTVGKLANKLLREAGELFFVVFFARQDFVTFNFIRSERER